MTSQRKQILFLNNTSKATATPPLLETMLAGGAELRPFWAAQGELPESLDGFSGAIVSGSPHSAYDRLEWIERESLLIRELAARDVPTLGICFGSQILASALLGPDQVYRRSDCEVGFKWLDVTEAAAADLVCGALERRIRMFVWHNDDVRSGHPEMQVLATSDACANQIWRHRRHPVWGVQGHLEITVAEAPAWFGRNRARLESDGADVDRLIAEAEEAQAAKTVLGRFIELCLDDQATLRRGGTGAEARATGAGERHPQRRTTRDRIEEGQGEQQ